jgi:hypothetical protein
MPRRLILSILPAGLLAVSAAAAVPDPSRWQAAGFLRPQITSVDLTSAYRETGAGEPKGTMPVYALLLRGGSWTRAQAEDHFRRAAKVYAQCGLMLSSAEIVEADPPGGRRTFVKFQDEGPGSIKALIQSSPLKARPVFYLIQSWEDIGDDHAWSAADFEEGDKVDPVLFDSVFFPSGVNSAAFAEERKDSPYTVAAHELLHVLTHIGGHYNEPDRHLLNIWSTRTDRIRPQDCERALQNPLVTRTP